MDNFRIDITSDSDAALSHALGIAFCHHSKAVGYRNDPDKGMVLFWTPGKDTVLFPFAVDSAGALPLVKGWLAAQEYGAQPDHDGDNGKGWRLYNEGWGHIGGEWEAFLAVKPAWAMYGK